MYPHNGNKVSSKNLLDNFLAYFWLALEKASYKFLPAWLNHLTLSQNITHLQDTQITMKKNFFFTHYKSEWKKIIFEDKEINKVIFTKTKSHLILINWLTNIDANQILVSQKELYGTNKSIKSFMWYNDEDVIRRLCIKLPQMIGYVKCFNRNKGMSFKVIDKI